MLCCGDAMPLYLALQLRDWVLRATGVHQCRTSNEPKLDDSRSSWHLQAPADEAPQSPDELQFQPSPNGAASTVLEHLQADSGSNGATQAAPSMPEGSKPMLTRYRKDANEVLMLDGPEALRQLVHDAVSIPVEGLFE